MRIRRAREAPLLLLLFASACAAPEQKPAAAQPGSGDAVLKSALHSYVVEFLRRNPTTNTYLGGAGLDPALRAVDGTLRDYSAPALEAEDRWLGETSKALEGIDAAGLSPNVRIDRAVALAQIRFMLRQHQVRRYQERALDTYAGEPFRAMDWQLQGMSQTGATTYGTAEEWALVISRVKAIPAFLAAAQTQLETGVKANLTADRRMLERDGLNTPAANAEYFGDTLPGLAATRMNGSDRDRQLAQLQTAGNDAATAYAKFRNFIGATFFDDVKARTVKAAYAADRYAFGAEEYDWALKNNFQIATTAAQLFDESWPIAEATRSEMVALAQAIGRAHAWPLPADGSRAVRAVFDQLSKDFPKSDEEMVSWYRDAAFRLVEFARKTGMFEVPADYKLEVVQTPPPLEASIDGAAYYPAPPFKNDGIGRYYVTPTHNDPAALKSNNRAAIADLSAHEGFPGHDWYYKVLTASRDSVSPVRWLTPGAVEDSSSMWEDSMPAEGWGLYAEALMSEPQPGAPSGFYTPEERLYQLQGKLYRDLRVRIDTGIHTGRLTYDAATTLFSEVVDFLPGSCSVNAKTSGGKSAGQNEAKRASCEAAERAIFRYSKWPTQAITYRLGKDQIFALREEAAKQLGDRFSAKTFHLKFINQGTIPSGYFRTQLLSELK